MKLGGWLVMLSTLIMFLSLIGIQTGLSNILVSLHILPDIATGSFNADLENSSLFNEIFGTTGILILILGGSVVIGLFARGYDVSLVYAPFIVFVGGLYISTFWSIIKYVATFNQWWMTSIIGLIFSALGIGFIMACVDYFGGR